MPYVGILTEKSSFSTTITPMLDLKFDKTVTSLNLPATGKCVPIHGSGYGRGLGNDWVGGNVNIIAYPDKTEIFFLYLNSTKRPTRLDVQNDKHSILKYSNKSPYTSTGKNQ